ncbi:hypothetical protein [Marinomonas algarum]|uniref:Uncharacterized protein n=1 Tax=Marinomonas algarum TaxID=2883105 RepID=A0A9X1LF63_9GAMM|nr:hypothetical protein [Marinomonas algarum]MCB5162568.1 hypothetical protein [Marinomonas algarum]
MSQAFSRELPPHQAFQTHCLGQMGVVSWLSLKEGDASFNHVSGTVVMPSQPWPMADHTHNTNNARHDSSPSGFNALVATSPTEAKRPTDTSIAPETIAPEMKAPLTHHLREQLNAGPEIIVEDLQPIEELAVDLDIVPEVSADRHVVQLNIRAYALANTLLILSDVPQVFSQADEVERLALKMGQALLKQPIQEWQGSTFSWPGELKNPHFWQRTDWLFGAIESYVGRLIKGFPHAPLLVLAGDNIAQLIENLPANSPLKQYPTARIVSLSELHRIPELRKEAWQIMQAAFFS